MATSPPGVAEEGWLPWSRPQPSHDKLRAQVRRSRVGVGGGGGDAAGRGLVMTFWVNNACSFTPASIFSLLPFFLSSEQLEFYFSDQNLAQTLFWYRYGSERLCQPQDHRELSAD